MRPSGTRLALVGGPTRGRRPARAHAAAGVTATLTAHEGARRVLARDLAALAATRPAIVDDVEAVHQLRVTTRRARALLGRLGHLFPARAVAAVDRQLRWLGRVTGPVRDLDVLLESIDETGDLEPLRQALTARRERRAEELAAALASARYRRLLAGWRALLAGPPARRAVASAPAGQAVTAAVERAHRKMRRHGRRLDRRGRAGRLHRLRIRGKELRYLLESFAELYPVAPLARLTAALRDLQGELGRLQDLEVGGRILGELAAQDDELAGAATDLRRALRRRRDRRRRDVARRFRRFDERARADLDAILAA